MARAVWIGLVTAALAVGPACSKKKKQQQQPEVETAARAPETGEPNRLQSPAPVRPSLSKLGQPRRIEPIAIEEMTEAIETPNGAKLLTAPVKPKVGERVHTTYCFENTAIGEAAAKVKASLEAKGWSPVHLRYDEAQPDRAAVASQKPPYRVSASVVRSQAPACAGSEGHAYVTVTMHKLTRSRAAPRPEAP